MPANTEFELTLLIRYVERVNVKSLETALTARPFRPFDLRIDGEVTRVDHPKQVFLAEQKTTVIVDVRERIHIFDTSRIAKLSFPRRSASSTGKQVWPVWSSRIYGDRYRCCATRNAPKDLRFRHPTPKLCDYLVVREAKQPQQHFVELKGKNFERALNQIESTLERIGHAPRAYCWIVAAESPRAQSRFQVRAAKLENQFNVRVKFHSKDPKHELK
jgi:hypothetical protein